MRNKLIILSVISAIVIDIIINYIHLKESINIDVLIKDVAYVNGLTYLFIFLYLTLCDKMYIKKYGRGANYLFYFLGVFVESIINIIIVKQISIQFGIIDIKYIGMGVTSLFIVLFYIFNKNKNTDIQEETQINNANIDKVKNKQIDVNIKIISFALGQANAIMIMIPAVSKMYI